ncbi:uncharacterized protein LOC124952945 isoform X2 [Vespa velutina]|uniref:uncharacterized protein LOC124952945 isoform X2 n=1 Tax=Vespa velutina TaxID=202808 RepID=UPI001FB1F44D|nr:uncharacterized protein LOC124952945 isoform X2 [Vespa velutina]
MKIPTLIFLCMVFICGLHGLSDAASIPTGKTMDTTEIGNNGFDLLSNVGNLLECNLLGSDKIPSSVEISTNPLRSLKAVLCFFFERIIDTTEKITNNKLVQPMGVIFENIVPSLKELLQNVLDSHILSPTYSSLIHTLLQLYNMGILLSSLSNTI